MIETKPAWFEDEDVSAAPEILQELQALVASPGWAIVSRIVGAQADYRLNMLVATPLKGLDGALEQEYIKGETAQLLTLRGLPTVLIDELVAEVKRMREDAGRADTNGGASRDEPDFGF
jgi:hypothetical protein